MTKKELKTDEPKHIIELVIKDKLKKEAEEWLSITDNHLNDERTHFLSESEYAEQAYLAGAEPREKRIADLEEKNRQLKNEVEDLRAYCNQIGKVKTDVLKAFKNIVAR